MIRQQISPFRLSFSVDWIQVQCLQRRTFLFLSREEYAQMQTFWESSMERVLKICSSVRRCPLFSAWCPPHGLPRIWRVLGLLFNFYSISVKNKPAPRGGVTMQIRRKDLWPKALVNGSEGDYNAGFQYFAIRLEKLNWSTLYKQKSTQIDGWS